jgi:thiamine biosynthesis lipoprotein
MPSPMPALEAEVWRELRMLDAQWNAWKPGEVVELNAALRRGARTAVAPRLANALRDATRLEAASSGCFNPAIGAMVAAWGFHRDRLDDSGPPSATLLRRWQALPRPSLAALDWRGDRVGSRDARAQIDLGAIGKGIAADVTLDLLAREGVRDALVNLGGNVAAMGSHEGRAWRIGIRDPHRDGLLAVIETRGREAVVTSGTYERRRIAQGLAVHHLIDPTSARPASAFDSVTVAQPRADVADAAATALLVAGPARWREVAGRMSIDSVLVVHADARVEATPAMRARMTA